MKSRLFVLAALVSTFVTASPVVAQTPASIKELSKRTVEMPIAADCETRGICDLKGAKIVERKIKVLLPNERADFATYMTDFRFVLEVDKPARIPHYAIIQFVRGCMYQSELLADGTERRDFLYVHKHFGRYKVMRHDDWVVDSSHADPLATSFETYGRFDLYKWNKSPADLGADNANWYFHSKPPHGTVFKADLIANTGLIQEATTPRARNSSLELETCLFKIDDVPTTSDETGTGVDRAKAVWCASWDHKFHYDFATRTVVAEKAIHPFCREPNPGPL